MKTRKILGILILIFSLTAIIPITNYIIGSNLDLICSAIFIIFIILISAFLFIVGITLLTD